MKKIFNRIWAAISASCVCGWRGEIERISDGCPNCGRKLGV